MLSAALRFGLSDQTLLKEISQRLQVQLQAASQEGEESLAAAQRALMAALLAQVKLQGVDFASRLLLAQVRMLVGCRYYLPPAGCTWQLVLQLLQKQTLAALNQPCPAVDQLGTALTRC
jgi:hypothetical protein